MDALAHELVVSATGSSVRRSTRVQTLWGGYGELLRLELANGATVVLKDVHPPKRDDRSHARKVRSYDVESAFYRSYASRTNDACRVARPIAVHAEPHRWLILLEDLDAAGFRRRARDLEPCVRWLAAFHARFLGERPEHLWEEGTYWHLATRPDELARTEDRELREGAPLFDRALANARFQTLVHGDAKPANFCFGADGVAAVDFQYVGGGCGMKDVAYLLHGSVSAREEGELLDRYFAALGGSRELEREWRALYPVACADFVRFLAGWSPGSYERGFESGGRAVVREALRIVLDTNRTAF
jgi:hypothetical protein